ncbi:SHOCT domain-containing protein [Streptosporangium sp. NPDC000396]|uniref:SHOCT domain-containing protein n=1 Tax=Streptosporangium sp. NPDC000396 TaxID=3366185 RepID=UPI0036CA124D
MIRILLILFILALIAAVVLGLALMRRASKARNPVLENPREILKRRYAAGEIDEDEYFRRMSGLSQDW